MTQGDDKEIQRLLKEVFPPADRRLHRDLWPAMMRRLEAPGPALSWYDGVLIAAVCGWVVYCPEGILQLLYHL
jgi:hypothetical protein